MLSLNKNNTKTWCNWSESVHCQTNEIVAPISMDELKIIVKKCREQAKIMRVVGAGHSFTPLVATSDTMISLHHIKGIDRIDHQNLVATIWAGTTLKDLGNLLFANGYAMENLGDINAQSIAGAISTGTHGTGHEFGSIPTQVIGLTLLTAAGETIYISATENSHLFQAARVSLGMLGIVIKVDVKVVPAYTLTANSYRLSLDDCLEQMDVLKRVNRNFEFYWFPYTETVQVKTMNLYKEQEPVNQKQNMFKKVVIENGVFWALSEMSKRIPKTTKTVSTLSALGVPVGSETNKSHLLYATPRLVKFQEMEYAVPVEALSEILREMDKRIKKNKIKVHFPIECRFVQQDDIWLSPSYKRNSAYIAVHMYKDMPYDEYFQIMEEVFQYYDGRPHWGKMHTMTYNQLNTAYPKLADYLDVRGSLDESSVFANAYVKDLFHL